MLRASWRSFSVRFRSIIKPVHDILLGILSANLKKFPLGILSANQISWPRRLRLLSVVDNDICDLCGHAPESCDHLFFQCPSCTLVLGTPWVERWCPPDDHTSLGMICPEHVPEKLFSTMVLLCCWHVWTTGMTWSSDTSPQVFSGFWLSARMPVLLGAAGLYHRIGG